jgi:hypothetical protein
LRPLKHQHPKPKLLVKADIKAAHDVGMAKPQHQPHLVEPRRKAVSIFLGIKKFDDQIALLVVGGPKDGASCASRDSPCQLISTEDPLRKPWLRRLLHEPPSLFQARNRAASEARSDD